MANKVALFFLIALATSAPAQIYWHPPVQLTDSIGFMDISAAMLDSTIHLVGWDGNRFNYIRSLNEGLTWEHATTLFPADTFDTDGIPDIVCSGGKVHIVFQGSSSTSYRNIFHISSSDLGETWSSPHQIFNRPRDANLSSHPYVTAKGDTLFLCIVLWRNRYNPPPPYVISFRSFDAGVTWRDSVTADPEAHYAFQRQQLVYSEGNLHFVYPLFEGGINAFYVRSTDFGLSWSTPISLSIQDSNADQGPTVAADFLGNILAAWDDGRVLTRTSTDNGDTWLPQVVVSNLYCHDPSCFIDRNESYILWTDSYALGFYNPKVMFSQSHDYGQTWSEPELISENYETGSDRSTAILVQKRRKNRIFHCFWDRSADMGTDLYYVRGQTEPTSAPDAEFPMPAEIILSSYPNPFNATTTISFSLPESGDLLLEIFDVRGCKIKTLSSGRFDAGVHRLTWIAGDHPSGVYWVRLNVGEREFTTRAVLIK